MALDHHGNGTVIVSTDTWCISNTGTPNGIYVRVGVGFGAPTVVFPYSEMQEMHAAIGKCLVEAEIHNGSDS